MARTICLWALLILVPLTSLRVICVDLGVAATGRVAAPAPACDEVCPRDAAPEPADPASGGCVLVAGGCSAVAAMTIPLPGRSGLLLDPPPVTMVQSASSRPFHVAPAIEPFSPPPERTIA